MARKYTHQQLLSLRESPLVCKPASLPPAEEWMGPMPDQNQSQRNGGRGNVRGKNEENGANESTTGRRPTFEARAKSSTIPEDIILGPPKTAFASATGTRAAGRHFDGPHRPSFADQDDTSAKNDRNSFRDKYTRDGQRSERDTDKPRDGRTGVVPSRRGEKDEADLWSTSRQPNMAGQDENERAYRRNGDRNSDREGIRDGTNQRGSGDSRREGEYDPEQGYGARRTGPSRVRNEKPWSRDEGRTEEARPEDQASSKSRDWRDKERRTTRGFERDWNRGAKAEMDPEWMGALEPENDNKTRSADDIETFKQNMRSGKGNVQDSGSSRAQPQLNHERTASGAAKSKLDTPLVVDSSFDGFFGLYKEPKKEPEPASANVSLPSFTTPGKAPRGSKFTALFGAKTQTESADEQSLPAASQQPESLNEDKEGFKHILNLLNQQQGQNSNAITPPRQPSAQEFQQSPPFQSTPTQSPPSRNDGDLSYLLSARPNPKKIEPSTMSRDFLLNLMRDPQQGGHHLQNGMTRDRQVDHDGPQGLNQFPNLVLSPQENVRSPPGPQGYYLDHGREEQPARDKLNPNLGADRRGPPPGLYDIGNMQRQTPGGAVPSLGFSPGMQRPPGLEQYQLPSQRQGMAPPPGFSLATRGQSGYPPGLIPNSANDRTPFGMPMNGRGMPPPGFMNGPPPGFPPAFHPDGVPYGGFGDIGNFGQGFVSGQQRR